MGASGRLHAPAALPFFSALALRSMQDLGLLQDQLINACYFYPASNTHFLQIVFNIVQLPLSWFYNRSFFLLGYS